MAEDPQVRVAQSPGRLVRGFVKVTLRGNDMCTDAQDSTKKEKKCYLYSRCRIGFWSLEPRRFLDSITCPPVPPLPVGSRW